MEYFIFYIKIILSIYHYNVESCINSNIKLKLKNEFYWNKNIQSNIHSELEYNYLT